MPDLVEDLFKPEFYTTAIEHSIDKNMSRAMLRRFCTVEFQLKLLQDLADGKYRVQPPHLAYIPKDDGSKREIYVNSTKDRVILSAVNNIWYTRHPELISPACKAYLSGCSCAKTVREVATQRIRGYKLDISKYFDSVPHEVINHYLQLLDTGSPLDKAIYDYYNDDTVLIGDKPMTRFKSLAQGCAVSAFLSNCVLKDIDTRMLEMCDYYCRYSDDMLLLGDNADNALQILQEMLYEIGLSLNPNKIESISSDREFKFLGFGIHGKDIRISVKDFEAKKRVIRNITRAAKKNKQLTHEQKLHLVIKQIMDVFVCWNEPTHSWIYTKSAAVNDVKRLEELDTFCKEHIRAVVTGKWNYTTNVNKVSEERLRNAGYVSLLQMYNLARMDRTLFIQECLQWKQRLK